MSSTVVGRSTEGKPLYGEATEPVKLKRCVLRNLGRVEQILACAERLMDRSEVVVVQPDQGAIKNA